MTPEQLTLIIVIIEAAAKLAPQLIDHIQSSSLQPDDVASLIARIRAAQAALPVPEVPNENK